MIPNQVYATVGAVVLVIGIFLSQYIKIQHLKTDIANLNTAMAYYEVELEKLRSSNDSYKRSVNAQNEAINTLAIDRAELEKKLEEWKAKPADVRYEVIYQIREVKSDDCEDIKSVLDSSRSIDFNSL